MKTVGLTFEELSGEYEIVSPGELSPDDVLDFDKMKVDELRAFALQSGIDIPQGAKRAEMIEHIKQAFVELSGGEE